MPEGSLEPQVAALLDQLQDMVRATPSGEQVELLEGLLVSADRLIERGGTGTLVRRLEELRNALQPRVSMEEMRRFTTPISVLVQIPPTMEPQSIQVSPPNGGFLHLGGIASKNDRFEVVVQELVAGLQTVLRNVDPSIYNTVFPFVPFDIGVISQVHPLIVTARSFDYSSNPPRLHLTFFGEVEEQHHRGC